MMSEKVFKGTISYLKIATGFSAVVCFIQLFFVGFDPWHGLDKMIWMDLYGSPSLPDPAIPAFTLMFLLFCWLSTLAMILMYLIARFALEKREKWAYWSFILIALFWPLGGAVITFYTEAWGYLISVGMMTLLFLPPAVVLFPFFRDKK